MDAVQIALLLAASAVADVGDQAPIALPTAEVPPVRERGIASWYGDGTLHGAITASGEPLDPTDKTCAHRTLPFHTMVLLVNPADRTRRVWCRINDRGPYGKHPDGEYRGILDVGIAAAKELGTYGLGLEPVEIRYYTRETRASRELAALTE